MLKITKKYLSDLLNKTMTILYVVPHKEVNNFVPKTTLPTLTKLVDVTKFDDNFDIVVVTAPIVAIDKDKDDKYYATLFVELRQKMLHTVKIDLKTMDDNLVVYRDETKSFIEKIKDLKASYPCLMDIYNVYPVFAFLDETMAIDFENDFLKGREGENALITKKVVISYKDFFRRIQQYKNDGNLLKLRLSDDREELFIRYLLAKEIRSMLSRDIFLYDDFCPLDISVITKFIDDHFSLFTRVLKGDIDETEKINFVFTITFNLPSKLVVYKENSLFFASVKPHISIDVVNDYEVFDSENNRPKVSVSLSFKTDENDETPMSKVLDVYRPVSLKKVSFDEI